MAFLGRESSKVLIVEDNPDRNKWFKKLTNKIQSSHCIVTDQVSEAIDALKKEDWDIIFLDHDLKEDHYKVIGSTDPGPGTGADITGWLQNNPDNNRQALTCLRSS